jgi:transketolase
MALAGKYDSLDYRVVVLLSDGETNEGSTWEAAMLAAHHGLDNLIAIVDYNKMQALGKTREIIELEPYGDKWSSFEWTPREVDGHDVSQLIEAFEGTPFHPGRPSLIIAHTLKGKGVCFMEDELLWHYRCPDAEEYDKAVRELG